MTSPFSKGRTCFSDNSYSKSNNRPITPWKGLVEDFVFYSPMQPWGTIIKIQTELHKPTGGFSRLRQNYQCNRFSQEKTQDRLNIFQHIEASYRILLYEIMRIKETVRYLRKNQTESEQIFWGLVRRKQFRGLRFYRQHPILYTMNGKKSFYVADFYCRSLKLVVEIDGSIHKLKKREDLIRDGIMELYGLNVIRLKAEDVINQKKKILNKLRQFIDKP